MCLKKSIYLKLLEIGGRKLNKKKNNNILKNGDLTFVGQDHLT